MKVVSTVSEIEAFAAFEGKNVAVLTYLTKKKKGKIIQNFNQLV